MDTASLTPRVRDWQYPQNYDAPPFYQGSAGTSLALATFPGTIGLSGSADAVLSFRSSPLVEFNILTNLNCLAHIVVI